ncbi:MAG: hypothetical protein HFF61_01165 [Oscillospiraceae bacterium]|nr:hypothetical protein [Oscillospiraceae bacterium]
MDCDKQKPKVPQPTKDAAKIDYKDLQASRTDPQGSYTGCPTNPYEVPVQDADDL